VRPAFWIARVLHLATLLTLVALKFAFGLGSAYLLAVVVVAAALVYEHRLVGPDDFSRMDLAFFTMNGVISVVFLLGVLADSLLGVGGMP
jgi:4-hydroxybenzoate polyprenyltransferase